MKKYFIVAGEPSGDLHGSKLIKAIKELNPNSSFMGHGGDNMRNEGMNIIEHVDSLAIMGFAEVLRHLPRMNKIMRNTVGAIERSKPDRVILIDYPGFNLRLAKRLFPLKIPITYFILPQAWAWKQGRVEVLKRFIDQSISIFPFENDWYKKHGLKVDYFGHPFVDIEHFNETTKSFYERHSLNINNPILTLLPGSRQQEVDRHWPIYLKAVDILKKKHDGLQILVGKHPSIRLKDCPGDFKIETEARKAMIVGTAGIVSSGTATLECAVEDLPIVVCYKLFPLTWFLINILIKVKYSSIVNLIMDEEIVPELLQQNMNPSSIATQLDILLNMKSKERDLILSKYAVLKENLGKPGVYGRVAQAILKRTSSGHENI